LIIKEQKKIHFINDCNAIVDYDELEKAILWYSKKPTSAIKHIYIHGNYPAVSIYKEKMHIHRLLMMYWMKRKLESNESVHHINGNKLNAMKNNLKLIENSKHLSFHNKGRIFTISHRIKLSEANKRRKGTKRKKRVFIDENKLKEMILNGLSINAIAKHFHCDWSTIRSRLNDNPELLKEVEE
jgi:hypothetical protein